MDTSSLQAQIDALQTQISTESAQLEADQAKLKQFQDELAQAGLVNSIEALTDLTAVNDALAADNSNYRIQDITPSTTNG